MAAPAARTGDYSDLNPSPRILLGPGPSMVHPRVLRAGAAELAFGIPHLRGTGPSVGDRYEP